MNKELIISGALILMLVLTTSANNLSAQNVTTNTSNAAGNMTASANQTASELGQNASSALNRTGESLQKWEKMLLKLEETYSIKLAKPHKKLVKELQA